MKRKADNQPNSISLLLRWAGKSRVWLIIAVVLSAISGLCTMLPYYGLYQVIAALTENACTTQVIVQNAIIIGVGLVLRFGLLVYPEYVRTKVHTAHYIRFVVWLPNTWRKYLSVI